MKTLMEKLQVEEDRLNQEQEDSHGEYEKMKLVFEKKIDLYKLYLKKEGLTELDRLRLENKKEWQRIYRLEKKTAELPEY